MVVSIFIMANRSASQTVRSSTLNSAVATADSVSSNPLDRLSSAQIALTAAQAARLPELNAIRNQADSDSITLRVIPNDAVALAKPQIVSTAQKSKQDIKTYVTQNGDTISSVAAKFGVTDNSIRWSNNITGNSLTVGLKLAIPPVNGIVYTVKAGDTPQSLATRFQSDAGQIISYNDAEIAGLNPGEKIVIPNGQIYTPVLSYASSYQSSSFVPNYGGNGYDYGYCTWWVAVRRAQMGSPVPANLGNASTWKVLAPMAGFGVGNQPKVGAIIWTDPSTMTGYWRAFGHVGIVERIEPDGSVWTSDMNSYGFAQMDVNSGKTGGWGRVSHRLLSPEQAAGFTYIY